MSFAFLRRVATRTELPATLDLAGRAVPLVVSLSPRARRLTLRADPARAAVGLTVPRGVSAAKAMAFIAAQNDWLAARVAKWPRPRSIEPGARLPLRGAEIVVDWAAGRARTPHLAGGALLVGGPLEALAARVERWLKTEAHGLLVADSAEFAGRIDLPPPAVRVGDPKGRWGSCSAGGGLAYSWRLVMTPDFVRRAVAAHEVAHLVHHNHGPAFHQLANELSGGEARRATRWLAANGAELHWVGRR